MDALCSLSVTEQSTDFQATWGGQHAIAKTPAKLSAYQVPSAIIVFVILVCKVQFVCLIAKGHKRPWIH
jgi:hypothetical protein